MSLELKTFLLNSYGASAYGHLGEVAPLGAFRIDGAGRSDERAMPFPVYVAVTGLDRFVLHLAGSPMHHEIEQLVQAKGGQVSTMDSAYQIRITLESSDYEFISQLSKCIWDLADLGEGGLDAHHRSIHARTARSLNRFAGLLKQYAIQTRGIEKTRPNGLFSF